MEFVLVDIKENEVVLSMLQLLAIQLKSKGIKQWTEWLSPSKSDKERIKNAINNEEFYFIKSKGKVMGMFSLADTDDTYWGHQNAPAKYLHSLTILPQFKGEKVGLKAISQIIENLKKSGLNFLRLDCISTNDALQNYYTNQGFKYIRQTEIDNHTFNLYEINLLD